MLVLGLSIYENQFTCLLFNIFTKTSIKFLQGIIDQIRRRFNRRIIQVTNKSDS